MRLSDSEYAQLKQHILTALSMFPNSSLQYFLSKRTPERARWDLLFYTSSVYKDIVALYDRGITDNHIDTALRKIMREN